jgi:inosine-uridine nucleoside N-ribohydrolase
LHSFSDQGRADILATIASTRYEGVAAVLNVFNTYFKRPDIPIGVPGNNGLLLKDWQHWTDTLLLNYPHKINSNQEVMKAVDLYRKLLSSAEDTSITIITVGFFTNIADLLKSGPDKYSNLPGAALVAKKVKGLFSMAGRFPSGKEFNVDRDPSASMYVFNNWSRPLYLSGFEIGEKIITGIPLVKNTGIQNSPVKDVFRICTSLSKEDEYGRKSWDQTALLIALDDLHKYYSLEEGRIVVAPDGSNTWNANAKGHFRII